MTYRMLDSISVANLPAGADAYAGYVDGRWATWIELRTAFPQARRLSIAVFSVDDADCLDVENGDATGAEVYDWFLRQVKRGVWRPVIYTSASNLAALLATMKANGFARSSFRIWSAHYGAGEHICGPATCGFPQADGTQWTDAAPGLHGAVVDESLLADSFFPPVPKPKPPPPHTQEDPMMLATGTGAQTIITFAKGAAKGLTFANDATLLAQPAPVLRVAAHSASTGNFHVDESFILTASGADQFLFAAADVDFVNVSRASGGPGDDVAVGWNLI